MPPVKPIPKSHFFFGAPKHPAILERIKHTETPPKAHHPDPRQLRALDPVVDRHPWAAMKSACRHQDQPTQPGGGR